VSAKQAGTTILMVSHDLEQVRRLADDVTLLDHRTIFQGPSAEVLTSHQLAPLFSVGSRGGAS
jgi:ABC-type Mn2+/Zn2+ transport system ATPase subunit